MKKLFLILPFAMIGLLIISAFALPHSHHRKSSSKHKVSQKQKKLYKKLDAVRTQKTAVKQELKKTAEQAHGANLDLLSVDNQLSDAQATLEDTQSRLASHRSQQVQLAKYVVQSQFDLAKQADGMRKRLRAMYEDGDTPLISVILGSANSGDLADRTYLVEKVATADNKSVLDFRKKFEAYHSAKVKEDQLVASIKEEEENERVQKDRLVNAQQQKQAAFDALQQKKEGIQNLLAQMDTDEATIQREIVASESVPEQGVPVKFNGRFIWPCHGPITSPFGMRYHPIFHEYRMHTGIDIGEPMGTPIHAAASGVVIVAQYLKGYGNTVIINHGGGISTVYGHASRLLVQAGEKVNQGQTIALVGMTGYATGPHCHFEVRVNGKARNPMGFLGG